MSRFKYVISVYYILDMLYQKSFVFVRQSIERYQYASGDQEKRHQRSPETR